MSQDLMTIKDVTKYLKLNRMTVYKLAKEGKLPAVKIGSEWRFDKALIDAWLKDKFGAAAQIKPETIEKISRAILVVDDEKDTCDYFARSLEKEGYQVEIATNGQKALKLVKEKDPALILLDLEMPGMDGIEVLEELKKIGSTAPVIVLSAYGEVDLNIKASRLGAHNYIVKPVNWDRIKGVIEEAIEKML